MNDNPLKDKWSAEPAEARPNNDVKHTSYSEIAALKAAYLEAFGDHGRDIMIDLIESPRLNGGKMPGDDIDGYYPGDVYANAVGLYFIERTMGLKDADDAYDTLVANINAYARTSRHFEVPEGHYPEQEWLEKFTATRMVNLIGTDHPPLGSVLPPALPDDKPGF